MKKLDINFAFEGFRLIANKPWALPAWGLVLVIGGLLSALALFAFLVPMFMGTAAGQVTPNLTSGAWGMLVIGYIFMIAITLVTQSIVCCAIYRAVLTQAPAGFGFIRLGGDEIRLTLMNLVFLILFLVAYFAAALVVILVTAVATAVSPQAGVVAAILASLGMAGLVIWVIVRLSLYGPQGFDEKRFNLFGSWELTGGRAWLLFFGYLIAFILTMAIYFVVMIVVGGVGGGAMMTPADQHDVSAILAALPVYLITMLLVSLVVFPLMMAIMVAPTASAYRALSGRDVASVEKVF